MDSIVPVAGRVLDKHNWLAQWGVQQLIHLFNCPSDLLLQMQGVGNESPNLCVEDAQQFAQGIKSEF